MTLANLARFHLPDAPGVYFFLNRRNKVLYIGKATSLIDRVKSYLSSNDILDTRGPLIAKMLEEAAKIKFIQTDSVLEALLLEAEQIKKYQPIYNSSQKDDKSYNYVIFTREDFPRVLVVRGKDLDFGLPAEALAKAGPFPHGGELKEALKIIRKIFPYRDKCLSGKGSPCFNAQIGLCPGVCAGWIDKVEYGRIIGHLILFFKGQKGMLARGLKRDMKQMAKEQKFEEANKMKKQIFALEHIQDVALIKQENMSRNALDSSFIRIEAYDIAHISGKDAVGVMAVVIGGELAKDQYRRFRIRGTKGADDITNLKEILTRRLGHLEWPLPDLIVVDGGVAQINAARAVLRKRGLDIKIVSVVKDERHKAREILGLQGRAFKGIQDSTLNKSVLLVNLEAHRFALAFHRKLRGKEFRI